MEWNGELLDQLTWHWDIHLRPRLDGLTDDEYLWEPVAGCWSIHPQPDGTATVDFEYPEPDPAPVTTIAWRLGHIVVGVFGMRNASHFGGPAMEYETHAWAPTAAEALRQVDDVYATWVAGARALGEDGLAKPVGPAEGPFAERTYAALLLHIHREVIHHGAEVLLLRDLYRHR